MSTRAEDNCLGVSVKIDGYELFVKQMEEMDRLVDNLAEKLERLGKLTEPISVTHNHYNLCVNTDEAKK